MKDGDHRGSRKSTAAVLAGLPTPPDADWSAWANGGGVSRAVDAWIAADFSATKDATSVRPFFEPVIEAQLFGEDAVDQAVIIDAIFVLLDQLDALIADARGREPAPRRTTVLEQTADYDPEKPRFLQLRRMGEDGGETVAYARWRRRGEIWARSWRLALVTLIRLVDDPSEAMAHADLAKRRRAEARTALEAYPTLYVVDDAALTSAASFDAFTGCEDDDEAPARLIKVVDDVLSAQFKLPGAKELVDRALAIKAADDAPPVDFYTAKNPRSRAVVHGASCRRPVPR